MSPKRPPPPSANPSSLTPKTRTHTPTCPQVAREFETVCPSLTVVSVYGGVSIGGHIRDLERGADVVVGTPGRVIDLIERDALRLDKVGCAVCGCGLGRPTWGSSRCCPALGWTHGPALCCVLRVLVSPLC